jgi:flagellin-like protein
MQRRIVKDEQAVSPVIAVILMVAITVVLAQTYNTAARTTVIATIKITAITGDTACSSFTILRCIVVSSDRSQISGQMT